MKRGEELNRMDKICRDERKDAVFDRMDKMNRMGIQNLIPEMRAENFRFEKLRDRRLIVPSANRFASGPMDRRSSVRISSERPASVSF